MAIVVDASLLIALVSKDWRSRSVEAKLEEPAGESPTCSIADLASW